MEVPVIKTKKRKITAKAVAVIAFSLYALSGAGIAVGILLNDTLVATPASEKTQVNTNNGESGGETTDGGTTGGGTTGGGTTPTPVVDALVINDISYPITRLQNGAGVVALQEYRLPVNSNGLQLGAVTMTGDDTVTAPTTPFEPEHVGLSDYNSGKDGFFWINFLGTGYIKIEGTQIYGGYTGSSTQEPTLPAGKTRVDYGDIVGDNVYLNLVVINQDKNAALTKSTYDVANLPYDILNVQHNYTCLDREAVILSDLFVTSLTTLPRENPGRYYCTSKVDEAPLHTTQFPFFVREASETSQPVTFSSERATLNAINQSRPTDVTNLFLKIPTTTIVFATHPIFGRTTRTDAGTYFNPYTNLALTTENVIVNEQTIERVIFPETTIELGLLSPWLNRNNIPYTRTRP